MSNPVCQRCKSTGNGVTFSLFPKVEGFSFGQICTLCERVDLEYREWVRDHAEETYNELIADGEPGRCIPFAGGIQSVVRMPRVMTYQEWIEDEITHWPYYEEWAEQRDLAEEYGELA